MNTNLTLKLPVEVIDYNFKGEVTSQVREKALIAWLGVRERVFISEDGDLLTKELRALLGSEWRLYLNLAAEMEHDPFMEFKRWGFVVCESASILKKLHLYKDFKGKV
jgi:hypothetical protein